MSEGMFSGGELGKAFAPLVLVALGLPVAGCALGVFIGWLIWG